MAKRKGGGGRGKLNQKKKQSKLFWENPRRAPKRARGKGGGNHPSHDEGLVGHGLLPQTVNFPSKGAHRGKKRPGRGGRLIHKIER